VGRGESRGGLKLVDKNRSTGAHGIGSYGALLGKKMQANETIGKLAIGLFSDQLVTGAQAPKINSADLKKFARG
jgi:hypothetical protein